MRASRITVGAVVAFLASANVPAGARVPAMEPPVTVSPGAAASSLLTRDPCPTFSWGARDPADLFEILVLELGAGSELEEPDAASDPALRQSVSGLASSWTPSLDQCLATGRRYAWLVRGIGADGERGAWSEPSLFEIAGEPSVSKKEEGCAAPADASDGLRNVSPRVLSPRGTPRAPSDGLPGSRSSAPSTRAAAAGDAIVAQATDALALRGDSFADTQMDVTAILGWAHAVAGPAGVTVTGVHGEADGFTNGNGLGVSGLNTSFVGGWGGSFGSSFVGGGVKALAATENDLSLLVGNRSGDDGFIGSDPDQASSDIILLSNDAVAVRLDQDANGEDADFEVAANGGVVFNVDESGTIRLTPTDTPEACSAAIAGSLYFDLSLGELCICRTTTWKQITTGADC